MKRLIAFWNKDLINKLILLTSAGIAIGVIALGALVARMPEGKSVRGAVAEMLPGLIRLATATPTLQATPTRPPTWMPNPTRTPTPPQVNMPTGTPLAAEAPAATSSPTVPITLANDADCIPANAPQMGRVVEIVDGNTIKVLMEDRVYVVRYLGVVPPEPEHPFFRAATGRNSELVFAHEVSLVADQVDKDAAGRLLRYVRTGETFVNLALIREGLAVADTSDGDLACAETFAAALGAARDERKGQWSLPGANATP